MSGMKDKECLCLHVFIRAFKLGTYLGLSCRDSSLKMQPSRPMFCLNTVLLRPLESVKCGGSKLFGVRLGLLHSRVTVLTTVKLRLNLNLRKLRLNFKSKSKLCEHTC